MPAGASGRLRRSSSITTPRLPLTAALAAAVLTLAACGGSSSSGSGDGGPAATGVGGILERADTLLFTGQRATWTLTTAGGETIAGTMADPVTCTGASCVDSDSMATTVQELAEAFAGPAAGGEATLAMLGGFDTAATTGEFEVTESLSGVTVTAAPEAMSYGFWGEHGFAAVTLAKGPLTGTIDGDTFSGEFSLVTAWATGDATGTNPGGVGGATWTGVAEAVETGDFTRLQGTATVRIADLSQPRVAVAIAVPDHTISSPEWANMRLSAGRFTAGTRGGGDWLRGDFHGPDHAEAWGVFDTTDYIGAFGAKRE